MQIYVIYGILITLLYFCAAVFLSALSLTTFPVLFFFSFLYYTDVGSTFLVLLGYALSLRRHHFFAATVREKQAAQLTNLF